jgi:hypoxanthine phosphoribosyltransferase
MRDYHEFLAEVLIEEDVLKGRIEELGAEISRDYAGEDPLLICILRGGVMFLTDLMRAITLPHAIEFMAVSSYGQGGRESSGQVRITLDLNIDIADWDVLLVEDIIDSGHTLRSVLELLSVRKPRSLAVCTLLDKTERREVEIPLHYSGFQIPNKFVFGYGLDIDDYYRNLPFVGVVDLARYQALLKLKKGEG